MNEQEFMLLTEEYLEGPMAPARRAALRAEVESNPDRRAAFERQARQHIRLHAQTSRIDFTESQQIARMVVDLADRHREPAHFEDLLRPRSFRERFGAMIQGLRADKHSPAYRNAREELKRMVLPASFSVVVEVAIIVLIILWVPRLLPTRTAPDEEIAFTVDMNAPIPELDPTPPPPEAKGFDEAGRVAPPPPVEWTSGPGTPGDDGPTPPTPGRSDVVVTPPTAPPGGAVKERAFKPLQALGNRTTEQRSKILAETERGAQTEAAVNKALQWLQARQEADGSWAGQDRVAMTGLAVLTYLAHGEVPGNAPYGDTVTRALKYLLSRQDAKGVFSPNVYAHAIATYALAEALTMTRIVDLQVPLDRGVRVIVEGQQSGGGFDYGYRKGERFDTSVSGWQIQALKAALIAGVATPELADALTAAARFLQRDAFALDGSGFVYDGKPGIQSDRGGRASMTGVGTLCLQMMGQGTTPQARTGLRLLQDQRLEWPATGKGNVYAGYYITQAKFQGPSKDEWLRWNRQMQQSLLARQKADGHWEQGDHDSGTHVYTTTLCALMLEVYYRYLPTYAKRPVTEVISNKAPDEVMVDVR